MSDMSRLNCWTHSFAIQEIVGTESLALFLLPFPARNRLVLPCLFTLGSNTQPTKARGLKVPRRRMLRPTRIIIPRALRLGITVEEMEREKRVALGKVQLLSRSTLVLGRNPTSNHLKVPVDHHPANETHDRLITIIIRPKLLVKPRRMVVPTDVVLVVTRETSAQMTNRIRTKPRTNRTRLTTPTALRLSILQLGSPLVNALPHVNEPRRERPLLGPSNSNKAPRMEPLLKHRPNLKLDLRLNLIVSLRQPGLNPALNLKLDHRPRLNRRLTDAMGKQAWEWALKDSPNNHRPSSHKPNNHRLNPRYARLNPRLNPRPSLDHRLMDAVARDWAAKDFLNIHKLNPRLRLRLDPRLDRHLMDAVGKQA